MDSQHFLDWLSLTCAELRVIHGKKPRICLILDNAPWDFKESEETKVPKRGSRKLILQEWLEEHKIFYEVASTYNVEIIRLPVRHCQLNPIELAWAGLKDYVRDRFRIRDVENLTMEWCAALGPEVAGGYFEKVKEYEEMFKRADEMIETDVEPDIDEEDSEGETTDDGLSEDNEEI
ncbi:unnamed protein product [Didymodactylos carnosus]|uniref:Tc1-like transposase DDE domain-containing protein n=1 Tax=Didymodactylos carnosus TaxID=1234261 RepID=A0A815WUD1_9BILA|nr:unnamed protein product [Didymodactylos carnosus]CAF4408486.1 unnamed protein product [Didymodactylos carnosus]CAF4428198.1 unnamed protein product [Didymodactylos carnosus]